MSIFAVTSTPGTGSGSGRGRGLLAYVLLAYALSWAWLLPMAVGGLVVLTGDGWPTHFPALLGPMVAALLVAAGTGKLRPLLASMVRVRVPLRWWAVALSPFILLGGVLLVDLVIGTDLPAPAAFAEMSGLPAALGLAGVALMILLVNGFGEETGWRGFALPLLQRRMSPLSAMLVLAMIWAGWHLPMFFVVNNFRGFSTGTIVGWLLGLTAGSILLGWLYNRSGGSVALVAVWHAGFNLVSATAAATGLLAAVVTSAVMAAAVALVVAEILAGRQGRPSVLGRRIQVPTDR